MRRPPTTPWTTRARSVMSFLATILDLTFENSDTSDADAFKDNEEIQASMCHGSVLVRCANIPDPFGPTITEEGIRAIVVSAETRSGGKAINDRRAEKTWRPLDVYEIDVLDSKSIEEGGNGGGSSESFESKISSTTIRKQRAEAKTKKRGN